MEIQEIYKERKTGPKSDWGTLVPRTNVENVMKLGSVLE
jgi:hypothetical protein